ncbi:MAG: M23 family metallopeptidase [Brevundimonas sp.]|uniref:M23 family metallopeptidase n=1 Tax=Brevundimonas sp. TaxID=1871086 RepID=UPI0025C1D05B|nr:M23 family metallopeptidase [Brevundimonas sp.]MBX3477796.1 M23 family metallopeptidase [Brevundimonas sp.]
MSLGRRRLLLGAGAALAAGSARALPVQSSPGLTLGGEWRQGGFAFGRTWPRALVFVDGEALTAASEAGLFVVGFDRDAPGSTRIEARAPDGRTAARTLTIAPGRFPSTVVNGLPPATVTPTDPELLARIQREVALKTEGFASRAPGDAFRDGMAWPLDAYRITSAWGSQRVLNGTPARPHYGVDLAAPQGTAIKAPADGRVALARTGLHFEGGLTLIDHGQGLITAYLHQSRIDVETGQRVARGQAIGRVGMTGRATGPHLCWRMKWRDRNLNPALMVGRSAPGLLSGQD